MLYNLKKMAKKKSATKRAEKKKGDGTRYWFRTKRSKKIMLFTRGIETTMIYTNVLKKAIVNAYLNRKNNETFFIYFY